MASLNRVLLIGHLTRAPELRYTANGTAVTTLTRPVPRAPGRQAPAADDDVPF